MARSLRLNDNGTITWDEARANGTSGVTLQAPASLAASYSLTLLTALPGSTQFLTVDNTGQLATSAGSTASLDAAYDSGGAGAGRVITADSGPVEASGSGGLQVTHSAPVVNWETTGTGEYNFRATAGQNTDIFEIQRGDQDADISDDTFDALFALDGANRRLGVNTAAPGTLAHFLSPSGDAVLTVEAPATSDAAVIFTENSTARFQVGYDQSAGGFLVSGTAFGTLDALFVEDATGDIGINELTPDAKLHVTSTEQLISVFESTHASGSAGIALLDTDTSDNTQVRVQANANDLELVSNAGVSVVVGASGTLTATNWSVASDGDTVIGDNDDVGNHGLTILAGANNIDSYIFFGDVDDVDVGRLVYTHGADALSIFTGTTRRLFVSALGMTVGATAPGHDGTNTLAIENGTAPTTSLTDGVVMYAEDVTASSELKVRDEAGNITVLSPHAEVHGHRLSEDMAWSFYSERAGRYVWVDMLKVVRVLERLSGEELAFLGETN